MSKVFILQKDIVSPTLIAKAGDRGKQNERDGLWWFDNFRYYFNTATVLGNPTWFQEEVKNEVASNDSFQWTDALVHEFVFESRATLQSSPSKFMEKFKQSHTPKPQADNKPDWEIKSFQADNFALCGYILNKNPDGTFGHYESIEQDLLSSSVHKIHSVKRLSDGEVFSVGDEVVYGGRPMGKIESFQIELDVMRTITHIDGFNINNISKEKQGGALKMQTPIGDFWVHRDIYDKLSAMPRFAERPQPQKEEPFDMNKKIYAPPFEKSKPTEQRIEIRHIEPHDSFRGNAADTYWYQFSSSKPIVGNELNRLRQYIENCLNRPEVPYDWQFRYTQQQVDELCEAAFNFSRDKLYNTDKSFRSWRFVNYQDYKQYVETSKTMYQKSKSQNS